MTESYIRDFREEMNKYVSNFIAPLLSALLARNTTCCVSSIIGLKEPFFGI